jgi:hypothetical protein
MYHSFLQCYRLGQLFNWDILLMFSFLREFRCVTLEQVMAFVSFSPLQFTSAVEQSLSLEAKSHLVCVGIPRVL